MTRSIADYEDEAVWVDGCLMHPAQGAARRLYQKRHGALSERMQVCHHCDVPECILDAHHFAGTQTDNMRDAASKRRLFMQTERGFQIMQAATHTPEARAKKQAALNTPEVRAKIRAAHLGKPKSEEHKAKIRAAHLGKPKSAEHVAKMKLSHSSPEYRARISAANSGKPKSAEHRAKLSAATKAYAARRKDLLSRVHS